MRSNSPFPLDYAPKPPPSWVRIPRDFTRWLTRVLTCQLAQRIYAWGGIALTLIAAAGFISDAVTRRTCQCDAARTIWRVELWQSDFYAEDEYTDSIFRTEGISLTAKNPFGPPWNSVRIMRPTAHWPFIFDVGYVVHAERYQTGGTRRYLCVFGKAIPVSQNTWPSVLFVH
jgi:hypothetical protein